ncbi:uncharacterized protein [Montipora capricornis]|uniref:uncharacterized protein n=1 Tax=Montipora capricornis TaxID=246305 RepID=UPI0035F1E64B
MGEVKPSEGKLLGLPWDREQHTLSVILRNDPNETQGVTQRLLCAKSCLAKKSLTIPRLELVAGHMAVNLATNVHAALNVHQSTVNCWLDYTVALYWIKGQREYRQFVSNRVDKIQQHRQVTWYHVPTEDNPANLRSRRGDSANNLLWNKGPTWLSIHQSGLLTLY